MNSDYITMNANDNGSMMGLVFLFCVAVGMYLVGVIYNHLETEKPRPSIRILANGQDVTYRLGDIDNVVITDKSTTIYCGDDLVEWKNGEHNKLWRGNND